MRTRKLYLAPLFVYDERTLLSIHASSAASERFFEGAGYQEGVRQQTSNSMTEILLFIRSFVLSRLQYANSTQNFLSICSKAVKDLAQDIARAIES